MKMAENTKTIAIDAGGCAPPIITPLDQREMDRAHVDAGIMSLADYVKIYGVEHNGFPSQVNGEG
jgi:hypothetical protein